MSRENSSFVLAAIREKLFQSAPGSMSRENWTGSPHVDPVQHCFNPLPAR